MRGKVIILSAPSGAGKTTVSKHLLKSFPELEFSISATTRVPRQSETNAKDYHYLTKDDFLNKIEQKEFIEWEEVYTDIFYGTLKSEVERIWAKNKIVVFDVDAQGGMNLKKIFGDSALSIFLLTPSIHELEKRLKQRGSETEETIAFRLKKAFVEIDYAVNFDKIVLNERLEFTLEEVDKMVNDFIC